jgi:nucleoside-triphosphatase THEP1
LDIKKYPGNLILLTGERGSGKTTLCSAIVENARRAKWQVTGVISPADFVEGHKTAIDILNLASGRRRKLAHLRRSGDEGTLTPQWTFDEQGLEWGNSALKAAVPCDLLVIDEFGPLELLRGQGLTAGLEAVESGLFSLALAVIRPELLEIARVRWPHGRAITIHAAHEAASLAETIWQEYGI